MTKNKQAQQFDYGKLCFSFFKNIGLLLIAVCKILYEQYRKYIYNRNYKRYLKYIKIYETDNGDLQCSH